MQGNAHTPKHLFVVIRGISSANDACRQIGPVKSFDSSSHISPPLTSTCINTYTQKKTKEIRSYCDAEQDGPDSGPSVQPSVDDQDETDS